MLISHIEPSADPQYILMKIECFRGQEKYAEARREIESYLDRHPDIDERDIFIAYLAELIYRDSGYSEARAFGEKEIAKDAGIHTQISIAKIHRWNDGLAEAQSLVFQSLTLIGDTSSYNDKFFVAEEAYYCGLFDRAADILFNLIQQYVDSPPLRRLLACLYELDDRVMFSDLLSKLPQEVKDLPYYTKYSAAYYTKIGDDNRAEVELDRYLQDYPSDLDAVLNKIGILRRANKKGEAETYLSNVKDYNSEPPLDQMYLAFVYSDFGEEQKAIDLAYKLRREHYGEAEIHLKYLGLILLGKVSNAIYKPELVEVATAVLVQSEESQHQYYICDACEDPIGDNELKPDHPLSLALIGAKVGDTIEYEESPLSKKNLSVLEIKCKYLYLHHDTIDGFTHRFPAATSSFYKLDLKTDEEGNPDLSPIFTLIDRVITESGV